MPYMDMLAQLDPVKKYLQKLGQHGLHFLHRLSGRKAPPGRVCVSFNEEGLSLVYGTPDGSQTQVQHAGYYPFDNASQLVAQLTAAVDKAGVKEANCTWVLGPEDYQLFYVDALNVAKQDLAQAAKWRIKDMVTFPVDDAAVEVFLAPVDKHGRRRQKMFVVVARQSHLEKVAHMFSQADLTLDIIDIPELAISQLIATLPDNKKGTAFLDLRKENGEIHIYRDNALYLARKIKLEHLAGVSGGQAAWDSALLELQRSFDYCESELGIAQPGQLILAAEANELDELVSYFRSKLGGEVMPVNLKAWMNLSVTLDIEDELHCLPALAGILRRQG